MISGWRNGYDMPKPKFGEDGMPKFYLCQILILDMQNGFSYSFRIGFVTEQGRWNIEDANVLHKVVRYVPCECNTDLEGDLKVYGKYFDGAIKYTMDQMVEKDEKSQQ